MFYAADAIPAWQAPLNAIHVHHEFLLPPGGATDPYSGPMGVSVSYERYGVREAMMIGVGVSRAGFYPRQIGYRVSAMSAGELRFGYVFDVDLDRRSGLTLVPFLGPGIYHRRFTYNSRRFRVIRPLLTAGANLDLVLASGLAVGLGVHLKVFVDIVPRVAVGPTERVGYRF